MSDKLYRIDYDVSSAVPATKNIDKFGASILKMDAGGTQSLATLKKINAELLKIATNAGMANAALEKLAATEAALTAQGNALASSMTGAAVATMDVDKAASATATTVKRVGTAADRTKASVEHLGNSARAASIPLGSVGTSADVAAKGVNAVDRASKRTATSIGKVAAECVAADAALAGMGTAAAGAATGLNDASVSAKTASESISGFVSVGMTIALVTQVATALSEEMKKARDYARETAEENIKLRDALRELAALKGESGPNDKVVGGVLGMMVKTGATAEEAQKFDEMWESTIVATRQKIGKDGTKNWQLSEDDEKKVKEESLRFAIRNKIDPKLIGEAVSAIGLTDKVKTADDVLGKLQSMQVMAVEGIGNMTPIYQATQKLSGSMVNANGTGATKSKEELMAIVSTGTLTGSPAATNRSIEQAWRDLSVAGDDTKKATFQKYGFKPGDDLKTRLRKIKPLIDEANENGGPGALQAMKDAGLGNANANRKIIEFTNNMDILEERAARAKVLAEGGQGAQRLIADNAKFEAENPDRFANANETAARIIKGQGQKSVIPAEKSAHARRVAGGQAETRSDAFMRALHAPGDFISNLFSGYGGYEQQENYRNIRDEIKKADPKLAAELAKRHPVMNREANASPEEMNALIEDLPQDVRAKVNRAPGVAAQIQALQGEKPPGAAAQGGPGAKAPGVAAQRKPPAAPAAGGGAGAPPVKITSVGGTHGASGKVDGSALDRASEKLGVAADKLLTAMQSANMPPMPSNFGNNFSGGHRA